MSQRISFSRNSDLSSVELNLLADLSRLIVTVAVCEVEVEVEVGKYRIRICLRNDKTLKLNMVLSVWVSLRRHFFSSQLIRVRQQFANVQCESESGEWRAESRLPALLAA